MVVVYFGTYNNANVKKILLLTRVEIVFFKIEILGALYSFGIQFKYGTFCILSEEIHRYLHIQMQENNEEHKFKSTPLKYVLYYHHSLQWFSLRKVPTLLQFIDNKEMQQKVWSTFAHCDYNFTRITGP